MCSFTSVCQCVSWRVSARVCASMHQCVHQSVPAHVSVLLYFFYKRHHQCWLQHILSTFFLLRHLLYHVRMIQCPSKIWTPPLLTLVSLVAQISGPVLHWISPVLINRSSLMLFQPQHVSSHLLVCVCVYA